MAGGQASPLILFLGRAVTHEDIRQEHGSDLAARAEQIAEDVLHAVTNAFSIDDRVIQVGAFAGIAAAPAAEVRVQDLLRREPVETDLAAVAELATGETVLITGAGGSIGSELCRQIARLAPSRLGARSSGTASFSA